MQWIELIMAGLVGLATSLSLIPLILKASRRYGLASPAREAHHAHQTPVPRLGGIALVAALLVMVLFFSFLEPGFLQYHDRWLVISGSLAMFTLGLWDDLFALGARRKLFAQILIASAAFYLGLSIDLFRVPFTGHIVQLGGWAWPVTVLWLVAMTNLINLIDGVDGLAGGICLMLMILLACVSVTSGFVPLVTVGMAGALLGFLRFNFPPARIYLGDGGAYFLGFLIGCMTISTSQKGTIFAALAAPLFVLALPIIDTSLAILRRGLRGLPLFRADRKHIHHRLLAMGHSRRQVVLGLYGFTAFFLMLGFLAYFGRAQCLPLVLGIAMLAIILTAGRFSFSREWFSIGRVLGNSLESRAEIQYAMSLSRCLALEGVRTAGMEPLAGDVVFIARKLGFTRVLVRLEDGEKTWHLSDRGAEHNELPCHSFRHPLPGNKYCFVELSVTCPDHKKTPSPGACNLAEPQISTFSILADLLAEGWGKAVEDWKKLHKLPVRFDAQPPAPAAGQPGTPNPTPSAVEPTRNK